METKGPHPGDFVKDPSAPPVLAAWFEVNQLKQLYRQGWLKRGVGSDQCESVAEHSFGVAMLAMWLADAHFPDLDPLKVLRMALIHDLGEVHAGDLTPSHGVSKDEKTFLERASVQKILEKLSNGDLYLDLWEEYEAGVSDEAVFVKQVDRLEMAMQAGIYQKMNDLDLSEFFNSAGKVINAPQLRVLLETLEKDRY